MEIAEGNLQVLAPPVSEGHNDGGGPGQNLLHRTVKILLLSPHSLTRSGLIRISSLG